MTSSGPGRAPAVVEEKPRPPRQKLPLPRILVVDDEPKIAASIEEMLVQTNQYRVDVALGGEEALRQIETSLIHGNELYDLILLDIMMPQMSGLDVLRWIRNNPRLKSMRVIILTGMHDKRDMVLALKAGADDYITKPYHRQELLARLGTAMRTLNLEKELERRSRQLATLHNISNKITSSLNLPESLQAGVIGVRGLLDVDVTAVFTSDRKRGWLQCMFVCTAESIELDTGAFARIPIGRGLIGRAFKLRNTQVANVTFGDPRFEPAYDAPRGYQVNSMMAAPFYLRGHPAGVLVAFNKWRKSFSEPDADLFMSLANTMTQAAYKAYLFREVDDRQQQLLRSRNALQSVLDGILHPIYTVNPKWQVLAVNRTKAESEGKQAEDLIGQTCYETFFGRQQPCEHCEVAQMLIDKQPHAWTVRMTGDDYLPQEWEVNAFPVTSNKAGDQRAVIVWQDRTEERRLENSLHQAAKLSAIGQLAAGVAHEINNPLTVIKTGTEMLAEVVPEGNAEDHELIEWMGNAVDRAIKVVRGLLDFARQSRYEFQLGDLVQSLQDAIDLVTYQLRKAQINVDCDFEDDLPQIVASWEHLKTVWLNMLINARDALEEIEEPRRIEIIARMASSKDHVQVLFHDNGTGIAVEQLAHIFVPFYTTKDPGKGTGLGLATCHRIIDRHGGEITVSSEPDSGTTFIIRIPVDVTPVERNPSADGQVY